MTQHWSPDTCNGGECRFEVDRDFSFVAAERACRAHESLGLKGRAMFDHVIGGNRDKNYGTAAFAEVLGIEHKDVIWSVDEKGQLLIPITETNRSKAAELKAAVEARIGAGKARVE